MIHQIRAHGLVQPQLKGHLQLGPHSIGRAHQDGILPPLHIQPVERAKAPDPAQHIAIKGFLRQVLDALLGVVAAAQIHPGVGVSHGFRCNLLRHGAGFLINRLIRRIGSAERSRKAEF